MTAEAEIPSPISIYYNDCMAADARKISQGREILGCFASVSWVCHPSFGGITGFWASGVDINAEIAVLGVVVLLCVGRHVYSERIVLEAGEKRWAGSPFEARPRWPCYERILGSETYMSEGVMICFFWVLAEFSIFCAATSIGSGLLVRTALLRCCIPG